MVRAQSNPTLLRISVGMQKFDLEALERRVGPFVFAVAGQRLTD